MLVIVLHRVPLVCSAIVFAVLPTAIIISIVFLVSISGEVLVVVAPTIPILVSRYLLPACLRFEISDVLARALHWHGFARVKSTLRLEQAQFEFSECRGSFFRWDVGPYDLLHVIQQPADQEHHGVVLGEPVHQTISKANLLRIVILCAVCAPECMKPDEAFSWGFIVILDEVVQWSAFGGNVGSIPKLTQEPMPEPIPRVFH